MTEEQIETRLRELRAMKTQQQQALEQARANLLLIEGGIQDCQFWLSKIHETAQSDVSRNGVVAENQA